MTQLPDNGLSRVEGIENDQKAVQAQSTLSLLALQPSGD